MVIVMKRAETFMSRNLESKSLRDCLDRQFAKLLQFEFIHIFTFLLYQTAMKETFVNDSIFITNRFLALKPLKITFNFATEFIIPINI